MFAYFSLTRTAAPPHAGIFRSVSATGDVKSIGIIAEAKITRCGLGFFGVGSKSELYMSGLCEMIGFVKQNLSSAAGEVRSI